MVLAALTAVLLASCTADPTQSDEYSAIVVERDRALAQLDTTADQLAEAQHERDRLNSEVAAAQGTLDDALAANESLQSELAEADLEISELRGRLAALDLVPDINREVERVCIAVAQDESGELEAAAVIEYDDLWEPYATQAELESRAATCAGFDYLIEIGLSSEFGDSRSSVVKWIRDVRIRTAGSPTEADLAALDATIADLNRLIDSVEVLRVSSEPAELTVHFVPQAEFRSVLPQAEPRNDGFVWINWNSARQLTSGTVLIRSDRIEQRTRSHLVREEVTQAFGLLSDSFAYSESIFQQQYTDVIDYAAIDEVIIAMLYRPEVRPGMSEAQLRRVLDWEFQG